jgi:hypothetical protein
MKVFGLKEEEDRKSSLKAVFMHMNEKPKINYCERRGYDKSSSNMRPAQLTLAAGLVILSLSGV